jgi:uncharacterized protein DUF6915
MATPYHHALSSARKWGGTAQDYLPLHDWFDQSKESVADFRHRLLRHHAQGIFELERTFGHTITLSTGRVIPTRRRAEWPPGRREGFRLRRGVLRRGKNDKVKKAWDATQACSYWGATAFRQTKLQPIAKAA